jgi:1-acyl-sn-glycerol-3-phosphate acyltransferase
MTETTRRPAAIPDAAQQALPEDRPTWTWKMAQLLVRIFTTVFFDLKVYGLKNVPRRGGVLVVTNHQSLLDPLLLGVRHARGMSYMAKSELFENKAFGWLIRKLGAFPVRQGAGDVGAIRETVGRLQEGKMLNIFPEGGRTEDGKIAPMQQGVALVVRRAGPGVTVVPAAIDGSYDAWPKGQKYFHGHPIRVVYGPPLDVSGLKGDTLVAKVDAAIRTLFERLRSGRMTDRLAAEPLD